MKKVKAKKSSKIGKMGRVGKIWIAITICIGIIGCTFCGTSIARAENTNTVYQLHIDGITDFSGYTEEQWAKAQGEEFELVKPWYSNPLYDEKYEKIGGFKELYDELMEYFDGKVTMTDENILKFVYLLHYYFAFNGVDRNSDGKITIADTVAIPFTLGYEKYDIESSDTFIVGYTGAYYNTAHVHEYMKTLIEKWGCSGEGMRTAVERYYEFWTKDYRLPSEAMFCF